MLNVVMLSDARLNVVMLSVARLNVVMMSVARLNVAMLSVVGASPIVSKKIWPIMYASP